jgi:UDP-N-acetylglucosamine transferase subunit ALG13
VILVTIGSMFPFDRFIQAMDDWAGSRAGQDADEDILAQIGDGAYEPRHMRWVRRLDRSEFVKVLAGADLVVGHAGMGTVISAGEHGKPVVILPRRAARGEHTNDHQVDTAAWLSGRRGIFVAAEAEDLGARIAEARAGGVVETIGAAAPPDFLARLRAFAEGR